MKTFTSTQKRLMAQLDINLSSDEQINSFYEGWEESSFECRANGIPALSFDKYLEQKIIWNELFNKVSV
jgi:hypothetical protein